MRKVFANIRSSALREDQRLLAIELVKVLKGWLLLHMMEADKKFAPFLTAKGIQ